MKRTFFRSFLVLALVGIGCVVYGLIVEPKKLDVNGLEFVSNKYSGQPLKIGVITDIHIGGLHVPASRVEKLVADMNAQNPDLVFLPGDFVDCHLSANEHS